MNKSTNDLTQGVVWKQLLKFLLPILMGLLFQQLYNAADAFIIGHFNGSSALAAVGGSAAQITNLILGFFTGLNSGATVVISQKYGSGDHEGLRKVLHSWTVFSVLIGLTITVTGYFITPYALKLMGQPEDIMADGILYVRIYFMGSVPLLTYNLFQGTLQAMGDSRRPLIYLITSCLVNIALDVLFVGWLKLGVAGVATASVISMLLCLILALIHLMRVDGPHRVTLSELRFKPVVLKNALRIGMPAGFQGTIYSISNIVIMSSVNSFGTDVVAAWTATGKLDGFYWVTTSAFATAICAFVGQNYGAGKYDRMKSGIRTCMYMSVGTTVVLSAILLAVARTVYPTFIDKPEVIDKAVEIMSWFVPFYFIWSYIDVLSGTFRGTGDTFRPMIIVLLTTCVLRVLWMVLVVPLWHTIAGISVIYSISWVITATCYTVYYFRGNWLKRRL